jgi:hypothetical protein
MTVLQVLMALVQMGVCFQGEARNDTTGETVPAVVCPIPGAAPSRPS